MSDVIDTRICYGCNTTYPLTEEYFHRNAANVPPFHEECKACASVRAKERRERKKAQSAEQLANEIEKYAISLLDREVAAGGNIPHSAELIEKLMDYTGGVSGFAKVMWAQFWQAPPGSPTRTKILLAIVGLVGKNTEMGGAKKPLELYSEEELRAELDKQIKQQYPRLVDARNAETA